MPATPRKLYFPPWLLDPKRPQIKSDAEAKAWEHKWKRENPEKWTEAHDVFEERDDIRGVWYTVSDLANLPPVQWLVDGLLVHREQNMYVGPTGSGKTAVVSSILWSWMTGQEYWLDPRFKINDDVPVEDRKVMYVLLEGVQGYWARAQAYLAHSGQSEFALDNMLVSSDPVSFYKEGMTVDDPTSWSEGLKDLYRVMLTVNPQVLVVDTLSRATPGMQENSSDVGLVVGAFQHLIEAFGCTVIIQHHTPKDGRSTGRGHSSIDGAMGLIVKVDDDKGVRSLEASKYRYAPEENGKLCYFSFQPYLEGFIIGGGEAPRKGRPDRSDDYEAVLGKTIDEAAIELGVSDKTIKNRFIYESGKVTGLRGIVAEEPEEL